MRADDGTEIALGFSRNLLGFKEVVPQAENYLDLGLNPYEPDFADQLLAKMERASRIHFDLSGMRMLNTPDGVLNGPAHLNPSGSTNWELRTIWDNPVWRDKTSFYRDGRVLSVVEVRQLP
jgi:hypothetical protein